MGFFSASLGETCTDCHSAESGGSWAKYADDNPRKNTARAHDRHDERHQQDLLRRKARDHLLLLPSRRGTSRRHSESGGFVRPAAIEGTGRTARAHSAKRPPPIRFSTSTSRPSAAPSGWAKLTSFAAKGTYQGYQDEKYPVDVFAKAPNQISTVIHTSAGDSTTTYDGRAGWIAGPATERPVSLLELTGGDSDRRKAGRGSVVSRADQARRSRNGAPPPPPLSTAATCR